jgi:hypothetical protein
MSHFVGEYDIDHIKGAYEYLLHSTANIQYANQCAGVLYQEILNLVKKETEARSWAEEDLPLPEDEQIEAAHPLITGRGDLYVEAERMVHAKRSKYALVDLVNWLLARIDNMDSGFRRNDGQKCSPETGQNAAAGGLGEVNTIAPGA